MTIIAIGIDLAKNVFAVHGVDEMGKVPLLKPKVNRADLLSLLKSLGNASFWHQIVQRVRSPNLRYRRAH
jgi:hypothetical protein